MKKITLLATSVLAIAAASPAFCQQANIPEAGDSTDRANAEIVVTAQKREQRLSDVGITITVLGDEQLKTSGINDVIDLPKITPGLSTGLAYTGYPVFSIRGVNFNSGQLATPPAVSFYVDEVPIPYAPQAANMLFDLERVEVLKGPQGTLFGQNSTGGSINVIAAKPTDYLTGGFNAEVNNFGQVIFGAHVSGPLTDTLRARLAVNTTQFGAWQRGYFLNDQKNGDSNKLSGRLLLDWTPTERLTVGVNLTGWYDHGELQQPQLALLAPAVPAATLPALIGYPLPTSARDADFDLGFDTHKKNRQLLAALRVNYELSDAINLTSLSSYISTKIDQPQDFDGVALSVIPGLAEGTIKTVSQELRLSGMFAGDRGSFVVGGNYLKNKIFDRVVYYQEAYSGLPYGTILDGPYNLTDRALGVYGNVDFEVVPQITLTGGIRYTTTKQTVNGCTTGNALAAGTLGFLAGLGNPAASAAYVPGGCLTIGPAPGFLPEPTILEQKQHNVSWRAGINFKPTDDSLIYGLVSRGFKSGTFPITAILLSSQTRNLSQEKLTAYEAGAKLSLFDRRMQLNVAAFYYDYRDKQFFTLVPVPFIGVSGTLVNIPKSKAKGIDGDVTIRPVEGLTLRGGITYIDTKVGTYSGFNSAGTPVDFTGSEFNFAPPISANFDVEYRGEMSPGLEGYAGVGGLVNSRTFADLGEPDRQRIPAYTTLDARVGVESEKGWGAGLFVRNLTNKYYWTTVNYTGDTLTKYAGMPRTFGAFFKVAF
ncbi:Outer membrane receptor proteins, mostly Fe transport [Sphingopyxis sp. YR583]|uniref:TonB-dependent receptor n=1 Tax=Sphingopyxis sp. YR583 TaxID=1881047 RepID=UPI0008A7523A|nr:TonB-dependent receptor [Sphingopyxis sp. YR583]SEH19223.1 Outer membrane receptor proteins, mostly Fe transport [Sphingopyxis sp. YR583]